MATKKQTTKKDAKMESVELGRSGTNIFAGLINEEYNHKLAGKQGIKIFDEMRKSDATVRAAILATQLPIRRANWFVKPASEESNDVEIRDFVHACLFDMMSITWDDFLRQALLCLPFGVMVFEKVFEVREWNGKQYIVLKKLAPRMPISITKWQTQEGTDGVTQLAYGAANSVSIPMEKLLIFVNEMEGENWYGASILRAAYKHWYIKSNLEKIDAIAFERQGLGIPSIKMPESYTSDDVSKAENILKNMRAHEEGFLLETQDMQVEFKDMKANSTRDPARAISYHDRQIVKAVLAHFIDLGAGSTGSRALSQDQTDLFLQSLEAVANNVVDVINKYLIPQLVDMNFDGVQDYPKIDYNGITRTDVEGLSTAYQRFQQAGAIKPTSGDERYIRETMGLPERTEADDERQALLDQQKLDQAKAAADAKSKQETNNVKTNADINPQDPNADSLDTIIENKKKASFQEIKQAVSSKLAAMSELQQVGYIEKTLTKLDSMERNFTFSSIAELLRGEITTLKRKSFAEENTFKGWRKLTFTEQKVNFQSIQDTMDKLEVNLTDGAREILNDAKDDYLKKLTRAVESGDKETIMALELKFQKDYTKLLNDLMKQAYQYAKDNAAREMGVSAPAASADVLRSINIAADTIASQHATAIVSEAKHTLVSAMNKGAPVYATIGAVDAAMSEVIDSITRNTADIVIAGHMNLGRSTVFDANEDKIYALQRSELLDSGTCNFCLSMDGRIIELKDPLAKQGTFHSGCRGIWVEILTDEPNPPKISGVPNSLRDRIGDAVNDIIQPPKPIVKKDSLADKKIKDGKAGKNASEMSTHRSQYCECGHKH